MNTNSSKHALHNSLDQEDNKIAELYVDTKFS